MSKRVRLTKEDMVELISDDTYVNKYAVSKVIDSLCSNIIVALTEGKSVQFNGFGTFEPKDRAARVGRNPHTNEPVKIPARVMPTFKVGQLFKDVVSGARQ